MNLEQSILLETGDYDTDSIEWGKEQKLAGQMAIDWVMKSIELGMAKKVDAVSTSPIHKGAIKLVGSKRTWTYRDLSAPDTFSVCADNVLMS